MNKIILIVIAIIITIGSLGCFTPMTEEELAASFEVYLDSDYTLLWDSVNMPDISYLSWSGRDENGWASSNITVYVRNVGEKPVKVEAKGYESLHRVPLTGYGVSSDILLLDPNENKMLFINLTHNPIVASLVNENSPDLEIAIYFIITE